MMNNISTYMLNKEHTFKCSPNMYPTYPIKPTKYINESTVKGYFDKDKLTLTQKIALSR